MSSTSRFPRVAVVSFVLLITLLIPAAVHAGIGFQPVSQDELKMTVEPLALGAPAIILYRQLDRDNYREQAHETNYYRIKILTEEGLKYAEIQIPFQKNQEKIGIVKARCIRSDGTITEFTGEPAIKNIQLSNGSSSDAVTLTVPGAQVGSIIEYYYDLDFPRWWTPYTRFIITNDLFTRLARFSLIVGRDKYMYPVWNWLPPGVSQPTYADETGGIRDSNQGSLGVVRVARLEAKNVQGLMKEDLTPPEAELRSRIDFLFYDTQMERVPEKFWKKVGQQRYAELEHFVGKANALQSAVSETVSPEDPPETKLRKLYARVQRFKLAGYIATDAQPRSAADLWKSDTGDAVHLNWLFLALARAAGVEAYGMWTANRQERFVHPATMDSDQLKINLVQVKLNGQDVYCDPGSPLIAFGSLPWTETGLQALRLDKDGGGWIQLPLPKSADSQTQRVAHLKVLDNGDVEGRVTMTYTGLEASRRRFDWRNGDRKWAAENDIKSYIPASSTAELTNNPDWSGSGPLIAEFAVKIPGWASLSGSRVVFPAGLFSAGERKLFTATTRTYPVYFPYPSLQVDDMSIDFAAGMKIVTLPQDQTLNGGLIVYALRSEANDRTVHITRALSNDALLLQPNAYEPVHNLFQLIQASDKEELVLQK